MNKEPKSIICPSCKRTIAKWDRKSSMNIDIKCRKCNKLVIFRPINETVEIKYLPQRVSASGMRFL